MSNPAMAQGARSVLSPTTTQSHERPMYKKTVFLSSLASITIL